MNSYSSMNQQELLLNKHYIWVRKLTLQFLCHCLSYADFQQEFVGGGVVQEQFGALLCGHPHALTRTDQALDTAVRVRDHLERGLQCINPCDYHSGISYSHKNFIYVARFLSMKCIQEIKQTGRLFPSLFIRIMYINNQKYQILVLENLYLSEFHFNAYTYKYTYFNDIKMYMYLIF